MIYRSATIAKEMYIRGKTYFPGEDIRPIELLANSTQELRRGNIVDPADFLADGNVWSTEPEDVADLFDGVFPPFVQDWSKILLYLENKNPAPRSEMITAIKQEALRRRNEGGLS